MSLLRTISSGLKSLFRGKQLNQEMDEELRGYLEVSVEAKVRTGMSKAEALRAARVEMGSAESVKQKVWSSNWESIVEDVWNDLRYSLRILRRSLGFTLVAVITLALGIGANTAIFSLVYTLTLRTLPVQEPGRLVELLHRYPGEPASVGFSWNQYQLMRDNNHVFSGLIAAAYEPQHVHGDGLESQTLMAGYVDGSFFPVLGVRSAIGRLIGPQDDRPGNPAAVAVVSWNFWKSRFDLDPAILGKRIIVENVPTTIVGVTARKFSGLQIETSQDIWLPLAMEPIVIGSGFSRGSLWLVGRLKSGASIEQAHAEMSVLYQSTLEEQAKATNNPFIRKMKLEIEPSGAGFSYLREEWSKPLLLLMTMVGVLLLLACTNLANMQLARGARREHEMALRISLGATRVRLVRQLLAESLILSGAGSLLGVTLAHVGAGALARIIIAERRPGPPLTLPVRIDAHVLLFTAIVAVLTGLLFGLLPAIRAAGAEPAPSLRQAGGRSETMRGKLVGKSLVVVQVVLSVVLLSTAAQFVRYLSNLEHLDLGFRRDHVLLMSLDPTGSGYSPDRLAVGYQELLRRLESIPSVRSATICDPSPISGAGANRGVQVEGYEARPGEIRNVVESWVAPKYFQTLGTPLLDGRDFGLQDQNGPRVAIINQTMARYYFGDRNPIGLHVMLDGDTNPHEIVGLVADAKYMDIREATYRTIYLDTFQQPLVASHFALRTRIDPMALAPDVRSTVRDVLKTVSVKDVTTLSDQVDASLVLERITATLAGCFGVLGGLLVGIGLYGLLAYNVARQIHEIGIRMALGASRGLVIRQVLRDVLGMVCLGLAIGAPIAFWEKHLAASLVAGLPTTSVFPIAFGVSSLIVIALFAAYFPARRAAKVDPMVALRYE